MADRYVQKTELSGAQFSYEALRLFRHCKNKDKVFEEVYKFVEPRKKRGVELEPETIEFDDSLDHDTYMAMIQSFCSAAKSYWTTCDARKHGNNYDAKDILPDDISKTEDRHNDYNGMINNQPSKPTNDATIYPHTYPRPTLEEIKAYALEKGYGSEVAAGFYREKTAEDWKVRGEPIRNWKSLLDSWCRIKPVRAQQYTQREYTDSEWEEHDKELLRQAAEEDNQ